jgi:GNAT superfamily N-acetyltransferase
MNFSLRPLQACDVAPIASAFAALGWNKPASQYEHYLQEQEAGRRIVLVAFVDAAFAGYLNVVWESAYLPFREENIPEIQDFNVLPPLRQQGIGTRLMEAAEQQIVGRGFSVMGIGVGMTPDYGAAQRLYVRRGYVPDGRGLVFENHFVRHGDVVRMDDGLALYLTKDLDR